MIDPVSCLMRAATRKPTDRLNIVSGITHERVQSGWADTNTHHWLVRGLEGFKGHWDERFASIPGNFTILPPCQDGRIELPDDLVPDLIIAQHRWGQFQQLKPLADHLHVPLLTIEHTLPDPKLPPSHLERVKLLRGDVDSFITRESRASWGWDETEALVVEHGIDTTLFCPPEGGRTRHTEVISVVNDWINRGWILGYDLWKQATQGLPVRPFGDTPGLSQAPGSVQELARELSLGSVFVCTARSSPIPMSLLEAMSSGLACVCIRQSAVATVIEHGVNGLLADDAIELRQHLLRVRLDSELRNRLGCNARETVLKRFPLGRFARDWERVFRQTASMTHQP